MTARDTYKPCFGQCIDCYDLCDYIGLYRLVVNIHIDYMWIYRSIIYNHMHWLYVIICLIICDYILFKHIITYNAYTEHNYTPKHTIIYNLHMLLL